MAKLRPWFVIVSTKAIILRTDRFAERSDAHDYPAKRWLTQTRCRRGSMARLRPLFVIVSTKAIILRTDRFAERSDAHDYPAKRWLTQTRCRRGSSAVVT